MTHIEPIPKPIHVKETEREMFRNFLLGLVIQFASPMIPPQAIEEHVDERLEDGLIEFTA